MKAMKVLSIVALLLLVSMAAAQAATLRTAPFDGLDVVSGFVRCAVTNASTSSGVASATLYNADGNVLVSLSSETVSPHATVFSSSASLVTETATHCECTVPSSTTWRCTVVYTTSARDNGESVTTP